MSAYQMLSSIDQEERLGGWSKGGGGSELGWAFRGTKGGSRPPILLVLDSSGGASWGQRWSVRWTRGKHQDGPPFLANGQALLGS